MKTSVGNYYLDTDDILFITPVYDALSKYYFRIQFKQGCDIRYEDKKYENPDEINKTRDKLINDWEKK